mgnify:CR=1 FL=1
MALMPKRVKYRKMQRGNLKGQASRCNKVDFGEYGVQALECGWVTANQIEACRIAANHYLKGEGKVIIRIFPHKSVTATPAETRMGKGKGEPAYWVACVKRGTILFEIAGASEATAREACNRIAHKLPIRVRFASRRAH